MSTHIVADKQLVASTVLLPGDPLRAQHIAETYLTDVVRYNEIRGMWGFTGTWKGNRVSVQGSGMGMPSLSIYAHELIQVYGVTRLVRVGTCGALSENVRLKDVLLVQAADTDSGINARRFGSYHFAPAASFDLLRRAWEKAEELSIKVKVGNILSSDLFYDLKGDEKVRIAQSVGTLGVEMESCELYTIARLFGVQALTMLTVSDSVLSDEQIPPKERETTVDSMVKLALATLFE